ncbi:MAG: hypothetical protein PHU85_11825 [Phycisphaerae bacterium]|nr:hypothetical protein [Phycisphaerae bacterium]
MNSLASMTGFLAAAFLGLQLAAAAATRPDAPAVPAAVQVWNCEPWQTVSVGDFSGANSLIGSLKPVDLIAGRNGVASGCAVVTRNGGPIVNLRAVAGDLTQSGGGQGRIAAGQVRVRFADLARQGQSWAPPQRFDRLLDKAPGEVPAVDPKKLASKSFTPRSTDAVATVPVWVTVRVPANASPGDYEGTLSIEVEGLASKALTVPIKLRVYDWRMPDPKDFRVRTLGWMNPEALAKHYGVPLWSDKHFDLMGKSMELMLELGSRHIQINVTKGYPAQDNADTMIKWVKQADGSFKYDLTLFDKYCDLTAKKIGKPFPVRLNIWHGPGDRPKGDHPQRPVIAIASAGGEASELPIPAALGSEEDRAFWKPVIGEVRARMEKRGWADATGCNWINYCGIMVNPKLIDMVKEFWPEHRWTDVDHGRAREMPTTQKGVTVPIFVQSTVWNEGTLDAYRNWKNGPYPRKYAGWFNPGSAFCSQARQQYNEGSPLWTLRTKHEEAILKGNDGLDMVGADMFPGKDSRGRYVPGEWSWAAQGPRNGTKTILGAGDEGSIGTERFEAMRAGIQLCEAMVFIQKALEAKKLGGDLEAKANKVLDDRAKALVAASKIVDAKQKFSPWRIDLDEYAKDSFRRDSELFAMAAEVANATAGK